MPKTLEVEATVTSKGQITLPAALRAKLGLVTGSKLKFISSDTGTTLEPELPISAYYGFLKNYNLPEDFSEIPKEKDRF